MSKVVENTYLIHNNPFIFTPLFVEFYKNYKGQNNDILLSYLILPLILHEETRITLQKARIDSSIHTFCRKKGNFYGLPERVLEYKELTNKCLQNAIDNGYFVIDKNLKVNITNNNLINEYSNNELLKASANFVKIIRELDIVAIYRLLGVKKI